MAENKTKRTGASVSAFLNSIEDPDRRRDCKAVAKIMKAATGKKPEMWGTAMVGYGSYRYRYASGREGEWFLTGFSSRQQNLTLHIMSGFRGSAALMKKLGKYKTGKSCLYLKRLSDVDVDVLTELVNESVKQMERRS